MILADLQFSFAIAQMHAVAEAVSPHLAVGTLVSLHPFAIAIDIKSILPDIPKTILIDVSLMIVIANAKATRNRSICKY